MVVMKLENLKTLLMVMSFLILPLQVSADSVEGDAVMEQKKSECGADGDGTMTWNSSLNRCVRSEVSQKEIERYKECAAMTDEAKRKECHDGIAKDESGSLEGGGRDGGANLNYIFGAASLLNTWSASGGKDSPCTSGYLAAGAGLLGGLAEKMFVKSAEKKLKKLRKAYKENSINEDPYQAQVNAFKFLKEEQELIEKMAKARQKTYYAIAGIYGYATYSVVSDWMKGSCESGGSESGSEGGDTTGGTQEGGGTEVADSDTTGTDTGGAAGGGETSIKDSISDSLGSLKSLGSKMFSSPATVAMMTTLGTLWNVKLAMGAGDQADEASDNASRIQEVIDDFKTNVAGLCPEGREDMQNQRCFCYNDDGSQNPNRTKSAICKALWAQDSRNLYVDGQGLASGINHDPVGCMDISGNFDSSCKCKKFKTSSGGNACMKIGNPTNVSMGGSSQFAAPQLLGSANNILNGTNPVGTFSGFDPVKIGAVAKGIAEQNARRLDNQIKKEGGKPLKLTGSFGDKLAKKISSSKEGQKRIAASSFNTAAKSRPQTGAIAEALKKAEVKTGIRKVSFTSSSKKAAKKKKKARYDFSFDDGSASGKVQKFMDKKYKYKENDIVKREDVSIWKVISKRYNVSGLKRLFPDE